MCTICNDFKLSHKICPLSNSCPGTDNTRCKAGAKLKVTTCGPTTQVCKEKLKASSLILASLWLIGYCQADAALGADRRVNHYLLLIANSCSEVHR